MEPKKTCDICGRSYKLIPIKTKGYEEWAVGMDTSHVHIRLREQDTTTILGKDICIGCAKKLIKYVVKMKQDAPRKCDFCEHDLGPKHPDHRKVCKDCIRHSHFQIKNRMSDHQKYEWQLFNGEV